MKVYYVTHVIKLNLIFLCLINASPAAHIQKNIATIIGSNVEVNIDVPSELSIHPNENNKTDENQEQRIVLEIKSNVEAINEKDADNSVLTTLLDKAVDVVQDDEDSQNKAKKNEVWKEYVAQKEGKWMKYKAADATGVNKNDRLIKILQTIAQAGGYVIQIATAFLSKDYSGVVTYVVNLIEVIVRYFFG